MHRFGGGLAEGVDIDVSIQAADQLRQDTHAVAAIADAGVDAMLRLAGAAVDDGYEVGCMDDAVLTVGHGVLADDILLKNNHD